MSGVSRLDPGKRDLQRFDIGERDPAQVVAAVVVGHGGGAIHTAEPPATCSSISSTLSLVGPQRGSEPSGRGLTADQSTHARGAACPHQRLLVDLQDRELLAVGETVKGGDADDSWFLVHDGQPHFFGLVRQPDEGDIGQALTKRGGLTAPVKSFGLDAHVRKPARERRPRARCECRRAAGLKTDAQDASGAVRVGSRDLESPVGQLNDAARVVQEVSPGGRWVTPPRWRSKSRTPSSLSRVRSA